MTVTYVGERPFWLTLTQTVTLVGGLLESAVRTVLGDCRRADEDLELTRDQRRRRAQDRGVSAEAAGHDTRPGSGRWDRVAGDRGVDRVEEHGARVGQRPTDHDPARVQQVD